MASNINTTDIDITYPVAGQDNDTQGFRTNFSTIKNNLDVAAAEISALQTSSTTTPSIVASGVISSTFVGNVSTAAGTPGQITYDANYWYFCVANNTWVRCPTTASIPSMLSSFTGNLTAGNIITSGTVINSGVSTTQLTLSSALQFANLTTTQINSISPASRGMTVYNYTSGNIQVYNGTKWANITLS
jgi:hypothetical protein